ncbi:hypothetical protein BC939DRAFT_457777 [Gamsiella multidivaricata]|uniref:uncharacterized protein n=1 Tax=Gamsiella multidivaricata TaxID=101098 RepID=UPI00222056D3|nr:uncharacterized protein BC939DRAFT_457777 [Gamsiella multidivaricata]KAI7820577.1 hypothetical protein BC939DRAFT_457777 [Gamsiella multidivaricata]
MRGSVIGVWHSGWTTHVSGASLAKGAADCTFSVLSFIIHFLCLRFLHNRHTNILIFICRPGPATVRGIYAPCVLMFCLDKASIMRQILSLSSFPPIIASMKESLLAAIKEVTALLPLSNPQYFLDTSPGEYSAEGYIISCRGPSVQDESTEKRLQDEWWNKLVPKLKESNDKCLQETGTRLKKEWKSEKHLLLDSVDELAAKKFKRGMKQAFQEHQLKVVEISSQRLEKNLTEILDESPNAAPSIESSWTPSPLPFSSRTSLRVAVDDRSADGNDNENDSDQSSKDGHDHDLPQSQLPRGGKTVADSTSLIHDHKPKQGHASSTFIPIAGQEHPRGLFDNENTGLPKTPRNKSISPTVVGTESIDSPPTVTSGPPEKSLFLMDEDEEDYLLPESASQGFVFKGMFEGVNVAAGFQSYFSEVKRSRVYIKHTDQALGRSGIILLKDGGTELQKKHFGSDALAKLRVLFHTRFWKTADVTTERSQVRGWLDVIEDKKFDRAESFTAIISSPPSSSLSQKLWTYILSALNDFPLVNDKSYSESTGVSSYITPLCRVFMANTEKCTFFNFVDKKTVSSQTTSSRKEPDMVLELKDASNKTICDLAFGEATSHAQQKQHKKNAKDVVRLGLNLKDSLDNIEDKYGVRDAVLAGAQVVADTMSIYLMARCGNMYLMSHEQDYSVPDSLKSLLLMNSQYKAFHELMVTIDEGVAPVLQGVGRTGDIIPNPTVDMLRCTTIRTPEFKTFLRKPESRPQGIHAP